MEQLILHLIGDYVTQSDWMAQNKTKSSFAALCHAIVYTIPFSAIGSSAALWVIFVTHFLIDRFRLARFVVWFKNVALHPRAYDLVSIEADRFWLENEWRNCKETGYPSERPAWLAVWLLIAADNTLHLAINWASLRWL